MARKIIILEKFPGLQRYTYACWLDVPVQRRPFYVGGSTQFLNATAPELAQFAAGEIVERVETMELGSGATLAQAQAAFVTAYNALQAVENTRNPWTRYGTSWDGTSWTAGGVT